MKLVTIAGNQNNPLPLYLLIYPAPLDMQKLAVAGVDLQSGVVER